MAVRFHSPTRRPSLSMRGRGGGGGGVVSAWQSILTLAQTDEWLALYDPTNPNTRTLRADGGDNYLAEIEDALGNLPALVQASEAAQPLHVPGAFGTLDAGRSAAANRNMSTGTFASRAHPITFVLVGKLSAVALVERRLLSGSLDETSAAGVLFRLVSTVAQWDIFSGASLLDGAGDTDAHVFVGAFNNTSSILRIDGAQVAAGSTSNRAHVSIDWLAKVTGGVDNLWIGDGGLIVTRNDVDLAPIQAMETAILEAMAS